ncbi:MAG: twin-arginine translocase TatA/TatE family subunit [Halobacteriovoraceae bacterium]|jgi:sec-independent protein translocase protein TatA|nr:twin-arginine translocase TatA/TatE family subunit [Halobacteriovoraceae bacterium]MBT5094293.1 twin-arginine translocase TatA/TatE family subunit [Halobacteriovoraceae bacterium]
MFGLGAAEIVVIGIIALIFIGPKKLPELAKGLGKGFREFQRAKDDLMNQVKTEEEGLDEAAHKIADLPDAEVEEEKKDLS